MSALDEDLEAAWRVGYEVGYRHATQDGAVRRLFTAPSEELGESALRGETHKREIERLKLESDRRARRVAEAVLERVSVIDGIRRRAIEDINIEALVDESKL